LRSISTRRRGEHDWNPRFNIAPTQPVPVIRQHPKEPIRQISTMGWGLVPHWAAGCLWRCADHQRTSETAAAKPAFRDSLKFRRCLIPADAFYEWVRHEVACVTVRRALATGPAIPLAVPYEVWRFGNESSKSPRTMYPSVVRNGYRNREAPVFCQHRGASSSSTDICSAAPPTYALAV
jgi:hypothetical protein